MLSIKVRYDNERSGLNHEVYYGVVKQDDKVAEVTQDYENHQGAERAAQFILFDIFAYSLEFYQKARRFCRTDCLMKPKGTCLSICSILGQVLDKALG